MSRRQAPPKPEELIQKLDDKLEAFKAEILASLEEKTNDISKLREDQDEEKREFSVKLRRQLTNVTRKILPIVKPYSSCI